MNFIEVLQINEQLDMLREAGYGDFVDGFLMNERTVTTKRGRLNKSGVCRLLDWKQKQLEETLAKCRAILNPEEIPEEAE